MLIFVKGHYLELIRQGLKTTTIRPWKVCRLKPGAVLSFNGRVRARLLSVSQVPLSAIDDQAARADGFTSRRAFLKAFRTHYPAIAEDAQVWILSFGAPKEASAHG